MGQITNTKSKAKNAWKKDEATYKAEQQTKVDDALKFVIDAFKSGDVPAKVAILTFPRSDSVPFDTWSFRNQLIALGTAGAMGIPCDPETFDARTFQAWKRLGRFPNKGSKALYILRPIKIMVKKEHEVTENGVTVTKEEKIPVIVGFKPHAVFHVAVTNGKDVPERKAPELPELPLMDKAEEWGVSIKGVGFKGCWYGCFSNNEDKPEIRLATPSEKVFLHEMAHKADAINQGGKLKLGQDPLQEITAELTAAILCRVVGVQEINTLGNSYEYIQSYAKEIDRKGDVTEACLRVLSRVEKCIRLLLDLGTDDKEQD